MNKNLMYVVGAVIIGALIWYGTSAAPQSNETPSPTPSEQQTTSETNLRALMAASTPQQCTFDDGQSTGTVYIANDQMRGDFQAQVSGRTETSHMILKNNKAYVWMDGQAQGFVLDATDTGTPGASDDQINLDQELDYDCSSWRVDSRFFREPSNVKFTDIANAFGGVNLESGFDLSELGL